MVQFLCASLFPHPLLVQYRGHVIVYYSTESYQIGLKMRKVLLWPAGDNELVGER